MSSLRRHSVRLAVRALLGLLVAVAATASLVVTLALTAVPAQAGNRVTPGNFTGYGFDQCIAPTQKAMDRWLNYSPFLAVGIYISGDSRGCRTQPNLSPTWVSTQLAKGWRLLPITLGPQASCHPGFPRYGNDPTINPKPGAAKKYGRARKQGVAEASKAVAAAQALGIVPRSTLWYDLEGFDVTKTHCRESALRFLTGWTRQLHRMDYVSGVYSSAGSGIKMLDDARVLRPGVFTLPDRIWIARWDGVANTSTSYIREDGWRPGGRMKQYQGGHDETWGGVRINIDRNYLDLGKGSVARPETHCDGVRVGFQKYDVLTPESTKPAKVRALQCLLRERGTTNAGPINGTYTPRLGSAMNAWQAEHGLRVSNTWTRRAWMTLLADGTRPVVKVGSAGGAVRRLQRALSASGHVQLPANGVFDANTRAGVRTWQRAVGLQVTGIMSVSHWKQLQAARR